MVQEEDNLLVGHNPETGYADLEPDRSEAVNYSWDTDCKDLTYLIDK